MSEHRAQVQWARGDVPFTPETYPRNHTWQFGADVVVPASAAPGYRGDADRVDPEEGLVAAVSSCHMLTFLAVAAKRGHEVDSYEDDAVGYLEKNENGRLAVTRIVLRPVIRFVDGTAPDDEALNKLHASAHRNCFITNSVRADVEVQAR